MTLKLVADNPRRVPNHVLKSALGAVAARLALHADALNELGHQIRRTAERMPAGRDQGFLASLRFLAHDKFALDENSVEIAIVVLRALLHDYETESPSDKNLRGTCKTEEHR